MMYTDDERGACREHLHAENAMSEIAKIILIVEDNENEIAAAELAVKQHFGPTPSIESLD